MGGISFQEINLNFQHEIPLSQSNMCTLLCIFHKSEKLNEWYAAYYMMATPVVVRLQVWWHRITVAPMEMASEPQNIQWRKNKRRMLQHMVHVPSAVISTCSHIYNRSWNHRVRWCSVISKVSSFLLNVVSYSSAHTNTFTFFTFQNWHIFTNALEILFIHF